MINLYRNSIVFFLIVVFLIFLVFFLSQDRVTEFNCIPNNSYKQRISNPLYKWFFTVYSNSLEYVADKHIEGENYDTAIKLLTRVSYIQMRLNGLESEEFIELFFKIKTTSNKNGEIFSLKDSRLRNIFSSCDGLLKSLQKE